VKWLTSPSPFPSPFPSPSPTVDGTLYLKDTRHNLVAAPLTAQIRIIGSRDTFLTASSVVPDGWLPTQAVSHDEMLDILDKLEKKDAFDLFTAPVPADKYPDYRYAPSDAPRVTTSLYLPVQLACTHPVLVGSVQGRPASP
jgi:hypothetical protein